LNGKKASLLRKGKDRTLPLKGGDSRGGEEPPLPSAERKPGSPCGEREVPSLSPPLPGMRTLSLAEKEKFPSLPFLCRGKRILPTIQRMPLFLEKKKAQISLLSQPGGQILFHRKDEGLFNSTTRKREALLTCRGGEATLLNLKGEESSFLGGG